MSERCPNKNSAEWKQMVKLFGEKNAWKIFIKENEEVPDLNRIERYAKGYALKQQEELPEGTFNYTEGNRTAIELNKNLAPGFVVRLSKGSKNGKQFWEYEIGRKQPMKAVKLMQLNEQKSIKPGVSEIFNESPELANIGTQQQYSQYLNTIFPDSKVKEIVYHKTSSKEIEGGKFKISRLGGVYFSFFDIPSGGLLKGLFQKLIKENTIFAVVNVKNPFIINRNNAKEVIKKTGLTTQDVTKLRKNFDLSTNDAILGFPNETKDTGQLDNFPTISFNEKDRKDIIELAVFEPEQIHILGSKQDIEKFKKWKSKNKSIVSSSLSKPNKALESKLFDFLNANGINVKNIKELQGRIGVDALGMADLAKRAVYLSDHRKEDTLPEEVAHFVIEAMLDNRVVQNALALVDQTDKYKENYNKYMKEYNDVDMVKKEVVGKLLADAILDVNKEKNKTLWGRLKTMLKAIAKRFKSLYKPSDIDTILKQSLAPIARNVIENNISIETPLTQTRYYQLKEQSKEIDSTLKVLTEAVQSRLKKLVISKQYRKEDITEAKIQELERIEGLILNNKTTDALLGFVKIIYGDAKGTLDRLKQLNTENLNIQDQADILRRAAQLNSGYSPLLKKVKHELLMGRMEDKEGVSGIINQLSTFLDSIDQEYRDRSKEIFKAAIKDYITLNPEVKEDDIIPMLEVANRDLNFGRTWLDSMAESGDDILASTDRMVKDFFEKTQMQVQQISYDLIEAENNLKKAGEKDTSFMVEKYADGSNTGYFISDYHMGNYTKSRKDHALKVEELLGIEGEELKLLERGNVEIIEKYIKKAPEQIKKAYKEALGLNKGNKDKYFYEIFLEKFKKEKSKLWKPWFDENTKQNPKAKELIKEHADKLIEKLVTAKKGTDEYSRQMSYAKELHEEWIDKNTFEYKGEVTYVGDLSLPADKYKTPLPTGAKREYYDKVIELKKELDKHLPETRLGLLAPQIRKDWLERFRKNPKAAVTEALKDFERREDDIEYGLADTDGNPVNSVPIFYRRKLSNMSDLSTDITATMTRYADMAVNYRNMKSLVNVLEIGKDILAERKIKTGKKDALSRIFALFNNKDTYEEKLGGNAYDRYVNYINMVIYGKNKKDEGSFNVFGYNIDKAKAMDAFTRYTAINNLALNLYAGIANPIIGNWTIRQEAMAKEFFSNKDINYGAVQYTKDLPALMGSIGDLRTKSKLRLFLEKVNALDDLEARLTDVNTSRSKFGRLFNESTLFAGMHMGEHQMRGRAALALANTIKFTLNGKEINLYDAFEVIDNNKLELKKGVEFSEKDMINFRIKLKGINKKMHGIYNSIDKSALQQYSLGRAALLFRKFIKPGFNRRWNRREFNYELMTHTEGYYVTGGKFWINFIKEMRKYQFSFIKAYKELTPEQKMNVVRFNYEMLSLLGLMVLAAVAESGLDDDDDYLVTMIAYQINRLQSEMMFFWNPTELPKLLKSPAAGVDMLNTTIGLFTRSLDLGAMFTDDPFIREYKSGPNAGDTYFWHSLKKTVPVVDTIEDWFDPDEKLKYFNR